MADVGYIRVSSYDQSLERQLDGVKLDKIFEDKASGGNVNREALKQCLAYLREGDVLHIHSIDRLARNLFDLQHVVEDLTQKGVTIKFHQENLTFFSMGASSLQMLLFQILGAFAQFKRACIKERQREGIAKCKAMGKVLGRPSKLSNSDKEGIIIRLLSGEIPSQLAKEYNVSVSTIHKLRTMNRILQDKVG